MTVEELLELPTIKGLKLISGNLGVHREISTVTVVDTPDGFQWLKGNEVVITTTYALVKTPNAFLDFISKLLSRNMSKEHSENSKINQKLIGKIGTFTNTVQRASHCDKHTIT